MATELDILILLKNKLVAFLDELIGTFPEETDLVVFRIFVKDQIPISDIMIYIMKNIYPLKDSIKQRQASVFLENNLFFTDFDNKEMQKVNRFKNIWTSEWLDDHNRETIWKWLDLFITICDRYNRLKK